jgi:hypothetical protein
LHKTVDDHIGDDDDGTRADHRCAGEREPRSLVRERKQQREAPAGRDGEDQGPRCAEPSSQWAGDKCAEDAANTEAGHDEAGRCRGQPDGTDQEDDEEGVDTGECQVAERRERRHRAQVGIPPGEAKTVEHAPGGEATRPAIPRWLHGGQAAERDGEAHRVGQQPGHGAGHLGEQPAEPWPGDLGDLAAAQQLGVPLGKVRLVDYPWEQDLVRAVEEH